MSHLNADPNSKSAFYRTKFEGESAVREAFPTSTIVRCGWMYGHEDRLLNTLAVSPSVFRVNHGETRIRPVHVLDVAQALTVMLTAPSTATSTFALDGPKTYTFETLLSLVEALTLKKLQGPNFPKPVLQLAAKLWDFVWWPTLSPDEVVRRFIDDVKVEGGMKGFADLGIEPDVLEDVAIVYLRRYRSRYASLVSSSFVGSRTNPSSCPSHVVPTLICQSKVVESSCGHPSTTLSIR